MLSELAHYINALDEGTFSGVIMTLKFKYPKISNRRIKSLSRKILSEWSDKKFEYWADWWGLNKEATASAV
jgi:hypothetical protein